MHIPWTTWTAASTMVQVATAFYPYEPSSGDTKTTHARRITPRVRDAPRRGLTMPLRRVSRDNTYTIVNSEDPKQKNSVAVDQDGSDISYMAAVTIGSSKEEYHLLLDSAASNTWVMGQECKEEACGKHNTFGSGDSDTLQTNSKTFSITYGTGSVSGTTASDTIHIGGVSTSLTFGLATNVSQEFNSYPMDGILGLGRGKATSLDNSPQLIETLATADLISSKLYGIHLSRAADGKNDGELNLGEVNKDRFDGDLNWLDTMDNDDGFWEISIADAGAGGKMAGLNGKSAIIDTGTSYCFMPEDDAAAIHKLIDGSSQFGETFTVPCSTTKALEIKFGDKTYSISSKDWVGGTTGGGNCRSNVFGRQTFGADQWLLGDVFLKNVYTAFDLDAGKVGFGTKSGDSTSTSTTSGGQTSSSSSTTASAASSSGTLSSSAYPTSAADPLIPGGASATATSADTAGASASVSSADQGGASSSSFSLRTVSFCVAVALFSSILV